MERPPSSLYFHCSECGEETRHRVLRGRYEGKKNRVLNVVAECSLCGNVLEEALRDEKEIAVSVMVSEGGETTRIEMILGENTMLKEGAELYTPDGLRNIVSSLESGGKRCQSAKAVDIDTIWIKRMEEVVVKVSVNKGVKTISKQVSMHYDEEVAVGELMNLDGGEVVVHRIKTSDKIVYEGSARAEDISRVYARVVKKKWS